MSTERVSTLDELAPRFRAALVACVWDMRAAGHPAIIYETIRTNERQAQLFSEGASKAATAWKSWHFYGLAADVIHETLHWSPKATFWAALEQAAHVHGLTWGGHWRTIHDKPHVQWGRCRVTPSWRSKALYLAGRRPAVWLACSAA